VACTENTVRRLFRVNPKKAGERFFADEARDLAAALIAAADEIDGWTTR
jgi:hypothetical protein